MPLEAAVKTTASATVMIGVHGAGLINSIFMRGFSGFGPESQNDTMLIEIFPPNFEDVNWSNYYDQAFRNATRIQHVRPGLIRPPTR